MKAPTRVRGEGFTVYVEKSSAGKIRANVTFQPEDGVAVSFSCERWPSTPQLTSEIIGGLFAHHMYWLAFDLRKEVMLKLADAVRVQVDHG